MICWKGLTWELFSKLILLFGNILKVLENYCDNLKSPGSFLGVLEDFFHVRTCVELNQLLLSLTQARRKCDLDSDVEFVLD